MHVHPSTFTMTLRNFRSVACQRTVCRMLIVAFAFFLLFPFHYHIHHANDPVAQGVDHPAHDADVHMHTTAGDLSHHADSHTVESATHVSLKSSTSHLHWVVILMAFVLTLPFVAQARHLLPSSLPQRLPCAIRHSTPPLRAPPRH